MYLNYTCSSRFILTTTYLYIYKKKYCQRVPRPQNTKARFAKDEALQLDPGVRRLPGNHEPDGGENAQMIRDQT